MNRFRRAWPWWRWALTGLSALALGLSGYLGWHYLVGGSMIGCDGGSSCDQVLNSRWSSVGGVLPVSGLAEGAYLAMLVSSFFIGPATAAPVRRMAWRAMLILVGAAAGSAVWFTIVQKWVIGAFCPYCMATHLTGLLLAALIIWRAPKQFDHDSTDAASAKPAPKENSSTGPSRILGPLAATGLTLAGVALAGILATAQVVFVPPTISRAGESRNNPPAIDPHSAPLIGSASAPYVVTLLFDYKCPHCQKLHFLLAEAVRRYQGKLAFALCPAPLSRQCNPYVPRDVDEFRDSCELAKIGLAVWVARREAFPAFDQWMFSLDSGDFWRPRTLESARAKAAELVGQAKFDAALSDPWIDRYLQASIRTYGDSGGGPVPKLIFGSRWVVPEPSDIDDLILILQNSLVVPKP